MLSGLLAAYALTLATPGPRIPKPAVQSAEVIDEAKRQVPDRIVAEPNGSYWVVRTSEGPHGWYRITSEKKLEFQRYDAQGVRLKRYAADLDESLSDGVETIVRHHDIGGREAVVVAWDTREGQNAGHIGALALEFYDNTRSPRVTRKVANVGTKTRAPTGGASGSRVARAVPTTWHVRTLAQFHLDDSGEKLVGMDVGYHDWVYIATVIPGSTNRIRVSALPRNDTQSRQYVTWTAKGRQARPIDMFCGRDDIAHVVGIVDDIAGPANSTDTDQVQVHVSMNPPPTASRANNRALHNKSVDVTKTKLPGLTQIGG